MNSIKLTGLVALLTAPVAVVGVYQYQAQKTPSFKSKSQIACEAPADTTLAADITFSKVAETQPKVKDWGILEGPVWVDGVLLMSNVGIALDKQPNPADLVMLDGNEVKVVKENYGSNGLTLDNEGFIVAPRHKDGSITRVINGQVIASEYEGARFNSPNDVVISSTGSVYFSDPDWQNPEPTQADERMYHVTLKGEITAFGAGIDKPNGVMLSQDERALYAGGTNGLFKYTLTGDGAIEGEAIQLTAIEGGVDGMSRDCAGNVYVTNHKQVVVFENGTDQVLKTFDFDKEGIDGVTNIAFGGEDGKTIFVTTMGSKPSVWSAETNIAGIPY